MDGTLLRYARRPEAVRIGAGMLQAVRRLSKTTGGAVALVTGRRLADLDRLFRGLRIAAAGQHGGERRAVSGRVTVHAPASARFDRLRRHIGERLAGYPGITIEDKGLSVALHFRGAPRLAATALRIARQEVSRLGGSYRVMAGHRVVEIRSVASDKGRAVRALMRSAPFRGRVPVFLGDDTTDEDAFAVVNDLGGHSIKVGRGRTVARYRLPGVSAVRAWLQGARRLSAPRHG